MKLHRAVQLSLLDIPAQATTKDYVRQRLTGLEYRQDQFDAECAQAWEAYGSRVTAADPREHDFDGQTYSKTKDKARLNSQLRRVFVCMRSGGWYTLREIASAVNGSESGVSARLRDFRKVRFGEHTVERRRIDGGLFQYRLVPNGELR